MSESYTSHCQEKQNLPWKTPLMETGNASTAGTSPRKIPTAQVPHSFEHYSSGFGTGSTVVHWRTRMGTTLGGSRMRRTSTARRHGRRSHLSMTPTQKHNKRHPKRKDEMTLSPQPLGDAENKHHTPMNVLQMCRYTPLKHALGNGKMTHLGYAPVLKDGTSRNRNGRCLTKNPLQESEPWIHEGSGNETGRVRVTVHRHHNGLRTDDGSGN